MNSFFDVLYKHGKLRRQDWHWPYVNSFAVNETYRNKLAFRIYQGVTSPSFGLCVMFEPLIKDTSRGPQPHLKPIYSVVISQLRIYLFLKLNCPNWILEMSVWPRAQGHLRMGSERKAMDVSQRPSEGGTQTSFGDLNHYTLVGM